MISDTTRTAVTAALLRLAADVAEGTADWEQVGSFVLFHHRAETVTVTASTPTPTLRDYLAAPSEGREGYEARKRAAKGAPGFVTRARDAYRKATGEESPTCPTCGMPDGAGHTIGCPKQDIPA